MPRPRGLRQGECGRTGAPAGKPAGAPDRKRRTSAPAQCRATTIPKSLSRTSAPACHASRERWYDGCPSRSFSRTSAPAPRAEVLCAGIGGSAGTKLDRERWYERNAMTPRAGRLSKPSGGFCGQTARRGAHVPAEVVCGCPGQRCGCPPSLAATDLIPAGFDLDLVCFASVVDSWKPVG